MPAATHLVPVAILVPLAHGFLRGQPIELAFAYAVACYGVAIAFALVACVEASAMRLWVWMFAALLLAWPRLDEGQEGTEAP